MSILKEISQMAENKIKEFKVLAGLEDETKILKAKVKQGFNEIGQYIINNMELWHDSHPQMAMDFFKLREILELKRTYNMLLDQINNFHSKEGIELNNQLEEFIKEKKQELEVKLKDLQKEKDLLAETIGKFYLTHHLLLHVPFLSEKYRQIGVLIQELQIVHTQIENIKKGNIEQGQKNLGQILDDIWPKQNNNQKSGVNKNGGEPKRKDELPLVERVRLLENSYIYGKPPKANDNNLPENFAELWEWNDLLPWQKPLTVLGRNEVCRIENQRYLGWIAKGRVRKPEKPVDCRKCSFRKPFDNKPEYYCSIIPNCNDQNAEGFRHGELAKKCNYFKVKKKRYLLHKS